MSSWVKWLISVAIVVGAVYTVIAPSRVFTLPFNLAYSAPRALTVFPIGGIPLPAELKAGDQVELGALGYRERVAIGVSYLGRTLPEGQSYTLHFRRGAQSFDAEVATVPHQVTALYGVFLAVNGVQIGVGAILVLLLVWRGRDLAAWALAVWFIGFILGAAMNALPVDGSAGMAVMSFSSALYLLSRVGFYMMADILAAPYLGAWSRRAFRLVFIVAVVLGSAQRLGGPLTFVYMGDATLTSPQLSLFFPWIYAVPAAMLLVGWRNASAGDRVKLGWVASAGVLVIGTVTLSNISPFGYFISYLASGVVLLLAYGVLVYALLRHRLVSISVFIDQALVYGLLTSLVVGMVASVNSLVLRQELPRDAGLFLQVVVPLGLGMALARVRAYLDQLVERVVFRRRYLADRSLRDFARRTGEFNRIGSLFEVGADEMRRHLDVPAIAFYAHEESDYIRMHSSGDGRFPEKLDQDDAALVAARSERRSVDLAAFRSSLGKEGLVIPMLVLGVERGMLVCADRPGEQYSMDERALLVEVAAGMGAAWRILLARGNEDFVKACARGAVRANQVKARAKALESAWAAA